MANEANWLQLQFVGGFSSDTLSCICFENEYFFRHLQIITGPLFAVGFIELLYTPRVQPQCVCVCVIVIV